MKNETIASHVRDMMSPTAKGRLRQYPRETAEPKENFRQYPSEIPLKAWWFKVVITEGNLLSITFPGLSKCFSFGSTMPNLGLEYRLESLERK